MSKINIIILVMAANLVLLDFVALSNNTAEPVETNSAKIELQNKDFAIQEKTPVPANRISINDLLAMKAPVTCTAQVEIGNQKATVKAYVADGNARTDSKDIIGGEEKTTYAIFSKDGYRYTWPSLKDPDKGHKINIATITEKRPESLGDSQNFGLEAKWDFDCDPYDSDGSEFLAPAEISFEDLTEETIEMIDNEKINPVTDLAK